MHVNAGTNLVRALSSLPPNVLNPASYRKLIHDMATRRGWELREWTSEQLRDIGCGAFAAVTQGNGQNSSDRLIRLVHRPKEAVSGKFHADFYSILLCLVIFGSEVPGNCQYLKNKILNSIQIIFVLLSQNQIN